MDPVVPAPTSDPLLDGLNPAQREAVETTHGPLLVIAGAGSGKTRVITHRIAYLISRVGVPPHQILAVTFTNKAAGEMRSRVLDLLGLPLDTLLPIGTFHSRCAAILRREAVKVGLSEHYQILDEDDQKTAIKQVLKTLDIDKKVIQPAQALEVISWAKCNMQGPEDLEGVEDFEDRPYVQVYQAYEALLSHSDAVDFDDLLLKVVRLYDRDPQALAYWRRRYPFVLVDEYQDTNAVQYRLLEQLAGEHRNLCVVGDEDQSIYSWRGADITNLLDFQKHFPEAKIVKLEQNYRSTKRILQCADAVIQHNTERLGKTLFTAGDDGPLVMHHLAVDGLEEAVWVAERIQSVHLHQNVPYRDIAVFYRINSLSRAIEDALRYAQIPYRIVGGIRFYERREIRDLMAYLRLAVTPGNDLAMTRVINVPKRGLGQVTVDKLRRRALAANSSTYAAAREAIAEGELRGKATAQLGSFLDQIDGWNRVAADTPPAKLLKRILKETNYQEEELGDPHSLDALTRLDNIQELLSTLAEWTKANPDRNLGDWLEQITLTTSSDTETGQEDGVSLMTIHCAKGLEFDTVLVIGMEEPLFPLARAIDEQEDAEEERRLFYVAVTRAKRRLVLTHAQVRMYYGEDSMNPPSRFLFEVPAALFEDGKGPRGAYRRAKYG